MASLQQLGNIAIIGTTIVAVSGFLYKSLIYLYCRGKNTQRNNDEIKDLRTRLGYVETELDNLQTDISKYRVEEAKKLDDIKTNQSEMKTDIAVIKSILNKNFPS